ncbi:sulfotransferase family protein [Nocardioides antri]|uniref:Sulfotransferase family protein n=1 Tax=Nocardioides antri TaxID=2607659 RepID=A0A5B1M1F9_9ACTN|nr:sulfotransferase family protein [Nocardioides antri]KAA1426298.1 sulfotransferase family protein [Nocardioides antri]
MDADPGRPAVTWREMLTYFPHRVLGNHVHALPDHGIVYVKNPKAGCSTVLLWLDRLHTGEHDFSPGNVHTDNRLPKVPDVGRRRIARMISGDAYRFSFVRDPLRRFQSAYLDKIVSSKRWRTQIQTALGQEPDPERAVSLDEFVTGIERQDPIGEMDPHWRPQHVNLMMPLVSYDHIGRIETFDADLEIIRKAADLPPVPIEVRNVAKKSTDSILADRPDLEERVRAIYAQDFEIFGY